MPAEWEPHRATWLVWPENRTTWPGGLLKQVEDIYLQMIRALLPGEKVNLLVNDRKTAAGVLKRLPKKTATTRLVFHEVKTVDTWIRDYGPIFVKNSDIAFVKWRFNAWGGKYADLARDNNVVDRIQALKNVRRFDPGIILEGGSIDMNGLGTCLTTEQCLLNPNRNPKLSRRDIESYLERALGARNVVWLKEGIEGDDTDGHIDDITRFVGPRVVVTAVEPDASDKNHHILEKNLRSLRQARDQDGRKLRIIGLPMPGRVGIGRGDSSAGRLPASYANFYIGNSAVLVPVYSHRNDQAALKIIRGAFPERKVVGIECTALVYGLGSIHCVTQQEPA
ncbi:MAG: agmatine deiminase family protein [Candidatus Omnitrophota bacterium]